jgi:hypothetical protein
MPVVALLAAACVVVFGVSPHAVVTFGDTFSEPVGLLAWWAGLLPPACAYAVFCLHH